MSYQVLARRWRPQQLNEMVGQEPILRLLNNALTNQQLHHAYLFSGPHGTGKTSLARIFAKCLNCKTGITPSPCSTCSACVSIVQGQCVDFIEIDAASRTKVEDTRELLNNIHYLPTADRYMIYLIDEVHMLSNHSFNALLKTLEEPPEHVVFLLATTDPQRLPATVRSRCLQFNLKKLSEEQIIKQFELILSKQSLPFSNEALHLLAQAAKGSLRDALSLLDQAIAYGELTPKAIQTLLGYVNDEPLIALLEALIENNTEKLIHAIDALANITSDFHQALDQLLHWLHQLALAKTAPDLLKRINTPLKALSDRLTEETIQLYYQIALIGKRDLPLSPSDRSGFEMIVLRMLTFQRDIESASTETTPPVASTLSKKQVSVKKTQDWSTILNALPLTGITKTIASHAVLKTMTKTSITLCIDSCQAALINDKHINRLRDALSNYFNRPIKLLLENESDELSPAKMAQAKEHAKIHAMAEKMAKDPVIQRLQENLDAELLT